MNTTTIILIVMKPWYVQTEGHETNCDTHTYIMEDVLANKAKCLQVILFIFHNFFHFVFILC